MKDKGIGFNRTIFLSWLEAAAEARLRSDDIPAMRKMLEIIVSHDLEGIDARRKTIDVLVNIWHKSALIDQALHAQALAFLPEISSSEHIWLHYGLTLLYYSFFRQTTAVIGQFARTGEPVTRQAIKSRLAAEIGHLGSLNRSAERVMASLTDWGLLTHATKGTQYEPKLQSIHSGNLNLQAWLLSCALFAHPAEQLPFPDLIRLPELFPFKFKVTIDALRANNKFDIQKQGMWDMVGTNPQNHNTKSRGARRSA